MLNPSLLRSKKLWAVAGAALVALLALPWWTLRSLQRVQVRSVLNEHAPFTQPPLEVNFSRRVVETPAAREVLEPGERMGLWTLYHREGQPPLLEVRLTDRGFRLFSYVGDHIVAVFRLGTRQATEAFDVGGTFPSRRARFRYVWNNLHPGAGVLGTAAPQAGRQYEGEVLLSYENDRWNVVFWSAPDFEEGVRRFRTLVSPPGGD